MAMSAYNREYAFKNLLSLANPGVSVVIERPAPGRKDVTFALPYCWKELLDRSSENSEVFARGASLIPPFIPAALAYMEAFPEQVRAGVPEDLKHPAHYRRTENMSVGVAPQIRNSNGGTHASPEGHYRVCHLRFLRSQRFRNKRFQFVLVDGTFVGKGEARTVAGPDEEEQHHQEEMAHA